MQTTSPPPIAALQPPSYNTIPPMSTQPPLQGQTPTTTVPYPPGMQAPTFSSPAPDDSISSDQDSETFSSESSALSVNSTSSDCDGDDCEDDNNNDGWIPDGVKRGFIVFMSGRIITDTSKTFISLDFSGGAVCAVADNNPNNLQSAILISCDRAPANGARLNTMLVSSN